MRTIHKETVAQGDAEVELAVGRARETRPGVRYSISVNGIRAAILDFFSMTDDALLAILLDRAEIAVEKKNSADNRERVTMLKKLKTGDDERGKAKRGPGRPKKDA